MEKLTGEMRNGGFGRNLEQGNSPIFLFRGLFFLPPPLPCHPNFHRPQCYAPKVARTWYNLWPGQSSFHVTTHLICPHVWSPSQRLLSNNVHPFGNQTQGHLQLLSWDEMNSRYFRTGTSFLNLSLQFYHLYFFPSAVVTKQHKLCGLKQQKLFAHHSSGCQLCFAFFGLSLQSLPLSLQGLLPVCVSVSLLPI